ncbi:MAG: class I SAM-dependent methyltransferase [Magnetococcales bacterium]|nr:class I SAM-dependent methyltransferase [Magnetococcales bacterium]
MKVLLASEGPPTWGWNLNVDKERVYSEGFSLTFLERWAVSQRLARVIAPLRAMFRDNNHVRVLELGCGYGGANLKFLSRLLAQGHFSGMDLRVSAEPVTGIELFEADLGLWQPESRWDFVFSLAVVEHLADPAHHFRLLYDCLVPGGLAVVTTPTPLAFPVLMTLTALHVFDARTILDHKCYFTREGIAFHAQNAGFRIIAQRTFQLGMNQYVILQVPTE